MNGGIGGVHVFHLFASNQHPLTHSHTDLVLSVSRYGKPSGPTAESLSEKVKAFGVEFEDDAKPEIGGKSSNSNRLGMFDEVMAGGGYERPTD